MLKVIVQLYPVIPAVDEDERRRLRPIGRNAARYQETLAGWHDIVMAAAWSSPAAAMRGS